MRILLLSLLWSCLVPMLGLASFTMPPVGGKSNAPGAIAAQPVMTVAHKPKGFRWKPALLQSLGFLALEHGVRLHEQKTREGLKGPFFSDWGKSLKNVGGWGDGDSILTNYIAHPMQGAVSGYIQVQNDPRGRQAEFGRSRQYWHSRLKALAWSAGYSTEFELGPISEAAIGNVGMIKGTAGWVDLVMTPIGGFGMMLAEDVLHRYVLKKLEARTNRRWKLAAYRIFFNPSRTFAGVMAGRFPWQRKPEGPGEVFANNQKPSAFRLGSPRKKVEGWNQLKWPGPLPVGAAPIESILLSPSTSNVHGHAGA